MTRMNFEPLYTQVRNTLVTRLAAGEWTPGAMLPGCAMLAAEMQVASEATEFERAAALRDRLRALTFIQGNQAVNPAGVAEADVIALHMDGGQACVQVKYQIAV